MEQALYRAYRPMSFDQVVGQDHITSVLKNQLKAGKPSHAYLFVGSRGTGKTTCAKLMAKAVNCLNLKDGNPCGVCKNCTGVDDGSLLDVTEIDAASNNGVENIRDLREEAVFTPASAKYRVYIIDEVHMLSTSAFNALLKILEEPPEHVIFILATTEIHKVLPTIISRCQRFDFGRIENNTIAAHLKFIAEKEGFVIDDDAALLIARLSEGGMRDAISLLDVCCASSTPVTVETVSTAAGLVGTEHLFDLCERIISGDCAGILQFADSLFRKNLEPQRLCEQLSLHFRNLLIAKAVTAPDELLECLPSEVAQLKAQAQKLSMGEIMQGLSILQDACAKMGRSLQKRSDLEIALISLTAPSSKSDTASLLARIERLEKLIESGAIMQSVKPPQSRNTDAKPSQDDCPFQIPSDTAALRPDPPIAKKEPAPPATSDSSLPPTTFAAPLKPTASSPLPSGISVFEPWPKVLLAIEKANSAIYGMMSGTKAFFDGKRVLIDIQNPVLLSMLKDNEFTKSAIKQAIVSAIGQPLPIGPYKPPEQETENVKDPLETLIETLSGQENIIIK